MTADIAVTGLGVVSPAGVGVESAWARVCAGIPTAALDPGLAGSPVPISCRVPDFDAALLGIERAEGLERFIRFALVAAKEAIADAGLDPATWNGARVGVVLGYGGGGVGAFLREHLAHLENGSGAVSPLLFPRHLPNMLAGELAVEFATTGPNLVVSTACASGVTAIGMARDLLALDRCDIALVGASESSLVPLMTAGFARIGALSRRLDDPAAASRPFDVDRDGLVFGEGAGIMVMERSGDARARGARVHARIVGYAATADAHHVTGPEPRGRGIERAVREALADAGAGPGDVDHVNAHGSSTQLNDKVEAAMLSRVLTGAPLVTSTKGVTGHLMGAAGAVEAIHAVLAVERGVVPPTANLTRLDPEIDIDVATTATPRRIEVALSNSFGFGGQNAVVVVARA